MRDFDMKPKPDEAQNTKFSWEERSLLICQTTFEISKFEKWPHPVRAKTKMDFHVSLGFHGSDYITLGVVAINICLENAVTSFLPVQSLWYS